MKVKEDEGIMREFRLRQSRQFCAIAVTLLLLISSLFLYKRPDIFGEFSRNTISVAEVLLIGLFIGFSAINWRCPSCRKYLGGNINRRICKECGTRLQ